VPHGEAQLIAQGGGGGHGVAAQVEFETNI